MYLLSVIIILRLFILYFENYSPSTICFSPTCSHSFYVAWNSHFINFDFHFLILRIKVREQFSNWQDKLKCVMLTNPFASLQKSHYLNFAGPGNYLSALCLVLLFFIHLFGLSDRVHFTFGTIFKYVSYTWVSPKEWHCCR